MAYDSKTFGQSPFGSTKPDTDSADKQSEASQSATVKPRPPADDGLDKGPKAFAKEAATADVSSKAVASPAPKLRDRFPNFSAITGQLAGTKTAENPASSTGAKGKSRASKSTAKSSTRKSSKNKKGKSAKSEIEAAEAEVARRFQAENRNAYLSLLYKTGISGLIWAVLRLLRYELPEDVIAVINIIIHPLVIAAIALVAAVALTFWLRYLLNDLAIHTQQLHNDAETTEGKNYRPTLEIVGDSLEYNPKLRKNFAALFNATSMLVCSLASYLMIFAAFPG